ncbi:MAG TPA: intradiol ring-cleavage dioxygenase [Anaerolineales bacterium]|jgi:protocatechuate 3,4-dioxygenase beta subunit|nr:intradiol ring-cleavage dioxygenase [Anaerolineales bacterium]
MENDDLPVGKILSRRDALKLLGLSGAALLAACTPLQSAMTQPASTSNASSGILPACVVRPEETEGPYYVDEELNRSDVRSDPSTGAVKDGTPLTLTFNVSLVSKNSCAPLADARVEIWHCDAQGVYSDVSDPGFNTKGQKFLRGYQETDGNGQATFLTIYPGWYSGRTIHIHFKIHPSANKVFTSQLFFNDTLSDQVLANAPYASRGQRNTLNSNDGIYNDQLLLNVTKSGDGYAAAFDIGVQAD